MSKRKVFSSVALMLLFVGSMYGVALSIAPTHAYPFSTDKKGSPPTPIVTVAPPLSIEGLLAATNSERSKAGVAALTLDPLLNQSAQAKCDQMVAEGQWGHVNKAGQHGYELARQSEPGATLYSENLAEGYDTNENVTDAWMHSQPHREALLNLVFSRVGYGLCKAGNEQYVVQHFVEL